MPVPARQHDREVASRRNVLGGGSIDLVMDDDHRADAAVVAVGGTYLLAAQS